MEDIKIYGGFLFTFLFTLTTADAFLKFCLTAVFIGYTSYKWYCLWQDRKNNKVKKDEED